MLSLTMPESGIEATAGLQDPEGLRSEHWHTWHCLLAKTVVRESRVWQSQNVDIVRVWHDDAVLMMKAVQRAPDRSGGSTWNSSCG